MRRIVTIVMVALFFVSLVYAGDVFIGNQRSPYTVAKVGPTSLVFGATDLAKTTTLTNTFGLINSAVVVLPTFANVISTTFSITNENGVVLYSKLITPGNTHVIQDFTSLGFVPLYGGSTAGLTLGNVPGGSGGTATITLYLQ